jgi:arylsulfatase A
MARLSPVFLNFAAFLLGIAAASCGGISPSHSDMDPPNVILIFADDLGYGDLGSYGHPTIRTPRLDRMAEEGLRLTSFYSAAPSCTPSRAALLTGRYPLRVGLPHVLGPESENGLSPDEITVATALKTLGYRTAHIGKWHLGHHREAFMPTSHGFDEYFGILYSNDMIRPWVQTDRPLAFHRGTEAVEHPIDQREITVRYTEEAIDFIRRNRDQPFFLYLADNMPHVPIYAAEAFRGRSLAGLYGDVIEAIDWSTGEILDELRRLGIDERTLVVFTSDNGPWSNMPDRMFGEELLPGHERIRPWHAGTAGLLRGSKATTYEGGFRVPAILRWPGRIPAGRASAEMATTMDLFATILDVAGAAIPSDRTIDGNVLTAFLMGESASPTNRLFYFAGNDLHAVREGPWKLRETTTDGVQLFHLEEDPGERFNRADEEAERVAELRVRMEAFRERVLER